MVSLVVLEASVGAANKVGPSCKKDIIELTGNSNFSLMCSLQSSPKLCERFTLESKRGRYGKIINILIVSPSGLRR